MLKYAEYDKVKYKMQPGDIIAFSGITLVDDFIKFIAQSQISHVAVVLKASDLKNKKFHGGDINKIIEVRPQVLVNDLEDRLKGSTDKIWWLPVRESLRAKISLRKLYNFALKQQGKKFKSIQAAKSQIDIFDKSNNPLIKSLTYNQEDYSKVFCSQFAVSVLKESGILKGMNTSELTPSDVCKLDIYSEDYYQIKGEVEVIKGYNSMSPLNW